MKTIKMEIELTYDDKALHSDGTTKGRNDFYRDVLMSGGLGLHIVGNGMFIGKVQGKQITIRIPKNKNQNGKQEVTLNL